jgi:hypothetical protein
MTTAEEDAIIGGRFVTPDLNRGDVAIALKTVEEKCGATWLMDQSKTHPLRELWGRIDFIALQELFIIGDSIRLIETIDPAWIADALVHIMSFEKNNRVGYMFEIVIIAAMMRAGHHVIPAPPNNEAYDVDAGLPTTGTGRVSIKNFGANSKEAEFRRESKAISHTVRCIAETRKPKWFGIFANCEAYPTSRDWNDLKQILAATQTDNTIVNQGIWSVLFMPPPVASNELSTSATSYSTLITAVHGKNESKNFLDSIENGSQKLNAHAQSYGPNVQPILMVRLSENADITTYKLWAENYLQQPGINLAGIYLLQTAVTQHPTEDATQISNNIDVVWRNGVPGPELRLVLLVGRCSATPSRLVVRLGDKEIPLDGRHMLSDTNVYVAVECDPQNLGDGVSSNIHQIPGYVTHGVLRFPDGRELTISPKSSLPSQLTMFS